jgi:hypothetical protein
MLQKEDRVLIFLTRPVYRGINIQILKISGYFKADTATQLVLPKAGVSAQ